MYYLEYFIGVILSSFYNLQYKFRFGRYKSTRIDKKTLYIHIPKTGGSAVAKTLGINIPGHFTIREREEAAGVAEKIVVTIRDPIERMISIWKYSRTSNLTRLNSPLKILGRYKTIDQFIASGVFTAFNKYHYFFRPQRLYMDGYYSERHELVILNQEDLVNEVKLKLNRQIEVVNKSPNLGTKLSDKSLEDLKQLYALDYKFLSEIKQLES